MPVSNQIVLTSVTGASPYIVYVCDATVTYCEVSAILSSGSTVPPTLTINVPPTLQGLSEFVVIIIDGNGCETLEYVSCEPLIELTIVVDNGTCEVVYNGVSYTATTTINVYQGSTYISEALPCPGYTFSAWTTTGTTFVNDLDPDTFNDVTGSTGISDVDAVGRSVQMANGFSRMLVNAGQVEAPTVDVPLDVMNPYITINYIIYTGRII